MQVLNNTEMILVFGKTIIKPQQSGDLPSEFDEHSTVDLLVRLHKITPRGFTPPTAPAVPSSLPFDDETETVTETVEFTPSDGIPPGWDELHGNKKKAWVKRQDDVVLLGKMLMLEGGDKIRDAIQARIDTLEARS